MREIVIKSKKGSRPLSVRREFYEREVAEGLKGCQPGEWVVVLEEGKSSGKNLLVAMANPMVQRGASIRVLGTFSKDNLNPESILKNLVTKAFQKRRLFSGYEKGSRLVYGDNDHLPGLIVDEYVNAVVLQINTAGLDRYRDFLAKQFSELTGKKAYLLDNPDYREAESLPVHESEKVPSLEVEENDLRYLIPESVLQKVGYYYDHRENRLKMKRWLQHFQKECVSGVDLFSYAGSWGLNALKGGCQRMTFVDQGNFSETIEKNLDLNNFSENGHFVRSDVFQWIKEAKDTYDLVISDPPAFSKSLKNKSKALGGYEKLHRGLSQIVHEGSLLVVASCTHGITLEELDQTVSKGFQDSLYSVNLLDVGIQGMDHGVSHFFDSGFYIKYLFYLVEKA